PLPRASFARAWRPHRPAFLACLRDVAAALPDDRQIYLTDLALHDDLTGTFVGKATTDRGAFAVRDRLKSGGRFADVKMSLDARDPREGQVAPDGGGPDAGRPGRQISFSMTFTYVPQK